MRRNAIVQIMISIEAIIADSWSCFDSKNLYIPIVIVLYSERAIKYVAPNSPKLIANAKIAPANIPGTSKGNSMWRNVNQREAPRVSLISNDSKLILLYEVLIVIEKNKYKEKS